VILLLLATPDDAPRDPGPAPSPGAPPSLASYFFVLYAVFVAAQCCLAAAVAAWRPAARDLVLVAPGRRGARGGRRAAADGLGAYAALAGGEDREAAGGGDVSGGAPVCPEAGAGLWSLMTFGWMSPLVGGCVDWVISCFRMQRFRVSVVWAVFQPATATAERWFASAPLIECVAATSKQQAPDVRSKPPHCTAN
jgi:hypothetical protein